jgi:16S rRNA (adenine1518-N6/adenine1519-N6)-dimethyltransferase
MHDYRAKKSLGQHFLSDAHVTQKILDSFFEDTHEIILEIGPGKGVLSRGLFEKYAAQLFLCEIDERSIYLLKQMFPAYHQQIIHHDILDLNFQQYFAGKQVSVIGNFPYNISTEIIFKVIENRMQVPLMLGMFQNEVAKRLAAHHNNKEYGLTTILLQTYYEVEYLFDVAPGCFSPPPKVMSGIIRIRRKENPLLPLDEKLFVRMVKAGFNTRRKTLRNALSPLGLAFTEAHQEILTKRAEQLSVSDWILFSNSLAKP